MTKDSHPKYINKIHTLTEKNNNLILKIAKDFKTCYKRNYQSKCHTMNMKRCSKQFIIRKSKLKAW